MTTTIDLAKRAHAADHAPGGAADLSGFFASPASVLAKGTKPAVRNTVAFLGDSITAYGISTSTPYGAHEARSWPLLLSIATDGQLEWAGSFATGGYTIAQIKATWLPQVLTAAPGACVLLCGRNDVNANTSYASVTTNIKSITDQLSAAGIMPIVCTLTAQASNTDTQAALSSAISQFVRELAAVQGYPLLDFAALTTDPLTNGQLAGYFADVSHPNPAGALLMAQYAAGVLKSWFPSHAPQRAIAQTTTAQDRNKVSNPLFLLDSNADGLPDGWATGGTATGTDSCNIAATAPMKGNLYTVTRTGGTGSLVRTGPAVAVAPGDNLVLSYRVTAAGHAASSGTWSVRLINSNDASVVLGGISQFQADQALTGLVHIRVTVPAGVTSVTPQLVIHAGTGSVSLAQFGVFNVTADRTAAGSTPSAPSDTTAPTVAITSPAAGATLTGTVAMSGTASDNTAVTGVDIYEGATKLGSATYSSGSWTYSLNSALLSNGSHTLTAKASDAAGNTTTSAGVTVTVSNVTDTTAPTVPAAPTTTAGVQSATSTTSGATDDVAVTSYRWYRNGTLVGTTSSPSFTETGLPAGTAVSYTVAAGDAAGNWSAQSSSGNPVTPTAPSGVFVEDTFTGTAGNLNTHTGESGATWAKLGPSDITVNGSGDAYPITANSQSALYRASGVPASADYEIVADIVLVAAGASGPTLGVAGRIASATSFYCARYVTSAGVWRIELNGSTVLGATVAQTLTPGQVYRLSLKMVGSTLTMSVDGTVIRTVTDTTITAAGSAGLFGSQQATDTTGLHATYLKALAAA